MVARIPVLRFLVLLAALLLAEKHIACAQFLPRDSLLRELETRRMRSAVRDSDYVRLLFLVARSYRPNTAQMRPFLEEARPLVAALNRRRLEGLLLQNCGNVLRLERKFTEARDTLQLAYMIFEQERDSANMASTAGLIAVMYQQRDMYSMALQYYLQEMEIADKCADVKNSFLARVNLSEISIAMQQPEKALYFVLQAEPFLASILKRGENTAFRVEWAKSMAAAYRLLHKPDSALIFAQQGVENAWKLRDTVLVVNLMAQEVHALQELKRFSEALSKLDVLVELDTKIYASSTVRPSICGVVAEVQTNVALNQGPSLLSGEQQQLLEQALNFTWQGLNHRFVSKKEMLEIYAVQVRIYTALGRVNDAFDVQTKLLALRDSVFTSSLHASIADMQEIYAVKQKESEIAMLQMQEQRSSNITIFLVIFAGCSLLLAVIAYQRFRLHRRSEAALLEANTRLQNLYDETIRYKNRIEEQNKALVEQEQVLRLSLQDKQFLAIVADSTAQMVIITDAEGYVQFVNRHFEEFTGFSKEEMLGRRPGSVLQGKRTDKETVKKIAQALHERRNFEGEIVNYTKDGREYWVHLAISPVINAAGECEHFVAIQYDATSELRKQAEERLQADLTLQSLIDAAREITMLVGSDFRMLRFNKSAYNAMRIIKPNVEPEPGMDLRQYSPIPLEEVERDFAEVMQGKPVAFDLDIPNPVNTAETLTFEVNYNPVQDLQGQVIAVSFIAKNITKRRKTHEQIERMNVWLEERVKERTNALQERALMLSATNNKLATAYSDLEMMQLDLWSKNQELGQMNKKLDEASKEKSEILGIVAHDLKSPLSGIQGLADMLRTGAEIDQVPQIAHEIYLASDRMFNLITNLLNANAIESGKIEMYLVALDACFLAETVVEEYTLLAAAKEIQVISEMPQEPLYVIADEILFHQALSNLVSNAVKYSPPFKQILVRAVGLHNDTANIVRFEVQDEGPGISEEDKTKLFGKFARLSAQPTGGEHSTGLGLNIVKKTVERMNGKVWCESELGKGATFIIELPMAEIK